MGGDLDMRMVADVSVAICVVSANRPHGLARTLEHITRQNLPSSVSVVVVVVDNAPGGPKVLADLDPSWRIVRVDEPKRGIAHARNRAVEVAGDVDLIAFFDDDECPRPDTLAALIDVWRRSGADVVQGASVPVFSIQPSNWIVDLAMFRRAFGGEQVPIEPFLARTSNVLITRRVLDLVQPAFDLRLQFTGGEDTFLFRTLASRGVRFVGTDRAVVDEYVPQDRMNVDWLIRRQFRIGWAVSFFLRDQDPSAWRLMKRLLRGTCYLVSAPKKGAFGSLNGVGVLLAGRRGAYGVGLIGGLFGYEPRSYDTKAKCVGLAGGDGGYGGGEGDVAEAALEGSAEGEYAAVLGD